MLSDPTSFEETLADQTITLVMLGTGGRLAGVFQPSPSAAASASGANARDGGVGVGTKTLKTLYTQASKRAAEVVAMLDAADRARATR